VFTDWAALSPDELRSRGETAFAYGSENFSLATNVAKLEALLRNLSSTRS
jgi:hypothetical protein